MLGDAQPDLVNLLLYSRSAPTSHRSSRTSIETAIPISWRPTHWPWSEDPVSWSGWQWRSDWAPIIPKENSIPESRETWGGRWFGWGRFHHVIRSYIMDLSSSSHWWSTSWNVAIPPMNSVRCFLRRRTESIQGIPRKRKKTRPRLHMNNSKIKRFSSGEWLQGRMMWMQCMSSETWTMQTPNIPWPPGHHVCVSTWLVSVFIWFYRMESLFQCRLWRSSWIDEHNRSKRRERQRPQWGTHLKEAHVLAACDCWHASPTGHASDSFNGKSIDSFAAPSGTSPASRPAAKAAPKQPPTPPTRRGTRQQRTDRWIPWIPPRRRLELYWRSTLVKISTSAKVSSDGDKRIMPLTIWASTFWEESEPAFSFFRS